jgi:hypothetical protein
MRVHACVYDACVWRRCCVCTRGVVLPVPVYVLAAS